MLLLHVEASLWWVTVNDVTHIAYEELRKLYSKFMEKTFGFSVDRYLFT